MHQIPDSAHVALQKTCSLCCPAPRPPEKGKPGDQVCEHKGWGLPAQSAESQRTGEMPPAWRPPCGALCPLAPPPSPHNKCATLQGGPWNTFLRPSRPCSTPTLPQSKQRGHVEWPGGTDCQRSTRRPQRKREVDKSPHPPTHSTLSLEAGKAQRPCSLLSCCCPTPQLCPHTNITKQDLEQPS